MRNSLLVLALIISFLTFSYLSAQTSPQSDFDPFYLYENLPKTPEAASLGVYGDITGNPYNGRANVSIPLHSISFGELKIPITLNYDSGGVKVAEDASWVGLNWNLSTNFGITRKINGQDDFDATNALNANGKVGFVYSQYEVQFPSGSAPFINQNDLYDIHNSYLPQVGKLKNVDLQPDIFEVSLFGKSYKFRMNKQQGSSNVVDALVFNDNNAVIEYNLATKTFQIIDDRGYIYTFSTKEYATNFTSTPDFTQPSSPTTIPSTARQRIQNDWNGYEETIITNWKLDSVESPSGELLSFNYQSGLHFTFPSLNGYQDFNDMSSYSGGYGGISGAYFNASTTALETKYLTSISGSFGTIDFILGPREDLLSGSELWSYCNISSGINFVTANLHNSNGQYIASCHGQPGCNYGTSLTDYRLNQINIKDYTGALIQDVALTYSYFNIDEISNSNKERYLRLKLNEVNIGDKKYTLSYINSNELPPKDSFDVDFWGYYNGIGNSHNVPSIGRFYTTTTGVSGQVELCQNFINYSGANRGSNFQFGKNGLLGKISYPTGGYTELTYEGHKAILEATQPYIITETLPNNEIRWTTFIDESRYKFTYQYLKKAAEPNYDLYNEEYIPPQGDPIIFEVDVQQSNSSFSSIFPIVLNADVVLHCYTGCTSAHYAAYINEPSYVVKRVSDGGISQVLFKYGDFPSAEGSAQPINGTANLFIPPGNYFVDKVSPEPVGNYSPPAVHIPLAHSQGDGQFEVITYDNGGGDLPTVIEQFEVGGARVNSITNYDGDGRFISKNTFDYTFYDNSNQDLNSSGKLVDELVFFSKVYGHTSYSPLPWSTSTLNFQSHSSNPMTGSAQGSHVGYSQVRELILDSSDHVLGETITNFFNEPNLYYTESFCREYNYSSNIDPDVCVDNTFVVGLGPKHTFDYANGQVLSQHLFNRAGNEVMREKYTYSNLVGQFDQNFYATVVPIQYSIQDLPTDGSSYFTYQLPTDFSLKSIVTKTETTKFLSNGSELFSEEIYHYDSQNHHLVKKETEIFEGDRIKQHFYYPYSTVVSSEPGMLELRNKNQISNIVMAESFRNTSKLNEIHYSYGNFGTNTLASKVSTGKGNQTVLTAKTLFNRYNEVGRLLQKMPASGRPTSFIWGYNNQYIIAKIDNISYSSIEALGAFGSNFTVAHGLSTNQENQLRGLSNSMVTTYTYTPGIGVESITDPRGYTFYYEYDSENRLQYVRDQDNNILEEYRYNLNNENIPEDIIEALGQGPSPPMDSDGDGWSDGLEASQSTDMDDLCSYPFGQVIQDENPSVTWNDTDCDGDGVSNGDELINGTNPLVDDSGGGGVGGCNPPCPVSLQEYLDLDRTLDSSTGLGKLVAHIQFIDQSAYSSSATLIFSALTFGGSGNYQYRWRKKGEEFSGTFVSGNTFSAPFQCSQFQDNRLGLICEVLDTVTGEIITARWSNVIYLECN